MRKSPTTPTLKELVLVRTPSIDTCRPWRSDGSLSGAREKGRGRGQLTVERRFLIVPIEWQPGQSRAFRCDQVSQVADVQIARVMSRLRSSVNRMSQAIHLALAHELVVLGVRSDPEPQQTLIDFHCQRTMVSAYSR